MARIAKCTGRLGVPSREVAAMIRNESEYQEALRRLEQDRYVAAKQREALVKAGLSLDEVDRGMEPLLSFQAQLAEEVAWYENVRRRNFPTIRRLTDVGRLLIALRIANGISQRELADRLGVSESVVSRDERNEYHGITVDRAQRILDALRQGIVVRVDDTPSFDEEERLAAAG
jgi:ribosome-binding protein aMBF1 (putative translation factor)